jgi:hypothetical protein
MDFDTNTKPQKLLSRRISIGFAVAALVLGLVALYRANHHPRTEDAEIFANFIGIAPQVEGPVIRLNVRKRQTKDLAAHGLEPHALQFVSLVFYKNPRTKPALALLNSNDRWDSGYRTGWSFQCKLIYQRSGWE